MRTRLTGMLLTSLAIFYVCSNLQAQDAPDDPFARWEPAIKAFEKDDAENPKEPGQILFIGSSSIRLWDLKKWFPDLDAINRGFGGSEVADSVHFYDRIVKPYQPRTIVMYAGDNDIAKGKTPQRVFDDFKQFVAKVQADTPKTKIVYVAVKPSLKRWNLIENVRATNKLVADFAAENDLIVFLDIDTPMIGEDGTPKSELFVKDGLHLSDDGYRMWSDLLKLHLVTQPQDSRFKPMRDIYDAYHPWQPPNSLEKWESEAEKIRRQVFVSNGLWPMPEKAPLDAVVHGKVDRGDYTVEKVYFRSRPGHYVMGSLYRPKVINGKAPAVLCPHGHWKDGRFYDSQAGAAAQVESGAEEFASGAHFPLQARMVQLARMGCIVFHYDMIGYADSQPLDHRTGFNDAEASLWLHNLMGLQTWNSIRALDFVESLPDVDTDRLAVTGASGGGTQTMILAAIDPRVDVAFPAVMVSTGMQGGCVCENASYLRQGVNNVAFAALFAPKPQAMSGADDWTIEIETKGLPELKQIYSLYGEADLVHAKAFPQFKHNYNQVSRQVMYNWLNAHLNLGWKGDVQQRDFWPLSQDEMTVFDSKHPVPADALDAKSVRKIMVAEDQQEFAALLDADMAAYRQIVGGAAQVMLKPQQATAEFAPNDQGDGQFTQGVVTNADGIQIPTTIVHTKADAPRGTVYWFTGTGASHLWDDDSKLTAEVHQLTAAGYDVVSADLFQTGDAMAPAGSEFNYAINNKYPGYTFCYNMPLITQRVRDILAVVEADLGSQKGERHLVGTEGAGPWVLLARSVMDAENLQTVADLGGFSFADIQAIDDPNLLPGALKYGGLSGLARLIPPSSLRLYGVNDVEAFSQRLRHFERLLKVDNAGVARQNVFDAITIEN